MKKITIAAVLVAVAIIAGGNAWGKMTTPEKKDYIAHQAVVSNGQTLWEICGRYTTNEQDIRELIDRVVKDNGIENATIYPGQSLLIRVKK